MNVREMRLATKLSQTAFANKFHIKVDTLRMWEQGVNKTPEHTRYMIERILVLEGLISSEGSIE